MGKSLDMRSFNQRIRSLTGVVQETLHRSRTNSMVFALEKGSDAASLNDAMEELEKILVDRIDRLKAAVRDSQAVVAVESQHAEQVIETLRTNIAGLDAKLRETEDTVRRKDVASQRMEESLSTKIRDLQSLVEKKEEALESQVSEVNDLKSKIDVLVKQVTHFQEAKEKAANDAQRAENLSQSSKAEITTLEAQLTESEQIVRGKDSTIKELEQNLTAKIQDLESQLRNKDKLLADRGREVTDLNSELERPTNGMKGMSSFYRQAGASADIQAQDTRTVVAGKQLKTGEEKPVTSRFQDVGVMSNVRNAARETVSRDAFDRIIGEFCELTNVMRPIASVIILDHVKALGESMEKFPKTRLTELLEALSGSDDKLKPGFRKPLGKL